MFVMLKEFWKLVLGSFLKTLKFGSAHQKVGWDSSLHACMNFSYELFYTDISYKFGDENNGDIQYPLISFCSDEFLIRNKILKDCNNHWTPFYQAVKKSLYFGRSKINLIVYLLKNSNMYSLKHI